MRNLIFFTTVLCTGISFSQQEKKSIERLWVSANVSPSKYAEVGAQVQFGQFLVGTYFQRYVQNVGPGIPKNPYAFFWKSYTYKRDRMNTASLMVGFASPTPHGVMLSFLAGPSFNHILTHSNFDVTYSNNSASNYHYPVAVSSSVTEQWKMGVNYKATVSFIIGNHVCINFGLAGNYNGVENYNRFVLGIGGGEFGRN